MKEIRDHAAFCCCGLEKALITGHCPAMKVAELFTAGGRQAGMVAGVTADPVPYSPGKALRVHCIPISVPASPSAPISMSVMFVGSGVYFCELVSHRFQP